MNRGLVRWFMGTVIFVFLPTVCATTELNQTSMDESYRGKFLSSIIVIAVTDDQGARRSFESKFVALLKATGIDAVSSGSGIAVTANRKLTKTEILKAVEKYGSDAVCVTHLIGLEKTEVYNPAPRRYTGFYGYYDNVYGHVHGRGYYSTATVVRLETNLYDAKTEKIIWSGQSKTWNPATDEQIYVEVVKEVIGELQKNKLLPKK